MRELKKKYLLPETIINLIQTEEGLSEKEKFKIPIYFLRKRTGETLEEIAKRFSKLSGSAVSKIVLRLQARREQDRQFGERLRRIEYRMSNGEV